MLRTGSGGSGVEAAPASPSEGFARTVSFTELGGAEYIADARRAAHATVCALACLAALAALVLVGTLRGADSEMRRLIVFDAGSSSTRVHVFELDVVRRGTRLPAVRAHFEAPRRASPGLADLELESDHADTEAALDARMEAYFSPLVRFAESVVPASARAETSTLLMATAGVRALPAPRAEHVLARCRTVLRRSAFAKTKRAAFTDASVRLITGADEGLYAWIAANYAAGTLHEPPERTVGVVELGGASAQVTFRPEKKPPRAYRAELVAADRKWAVYTHSALGLGLDAARAAYERRARLAVSHSETNSSERSMRGGDVEGNATDARGDPCALAGDETAGDSLRATSRGDFAACRAACAELMGARRDADDDADDARCLPETSRENATSPPTTSDGRCGFGGSFLPEPRGSFLLTENFAHTARFLRDAGFLTDADVVAQATSASTLSIARIADAGHRLCSTTREALAARLAGRGANASRAAAAGDEPAAGRVWETEPAEPARALRIRNACFATSYVVAALADVLRVNDTRNALRFGDKVRGVKVDWAVGAAIAHEARNELGRAENAENAEKTSSRRREGRSRSWIDLRARVARVTTPSVPNARGVGPAERLGAVVAVGLVLALAFGASVFFFVGASARASPSGAPRATRARLRLGELRVRRRLGMPSKGGVTSPTKRAAGEDAHKGN